jgi:hypothetical protein
MSKKSKKAKDKFPDRIYVTIPDPTDPIDYLLDGYKDVESVIVPEGKMRVTVGVYELVATNIVKITKTLE